MACSDSSCLVIVAVATIITSFMLSIVTLAIAVITITITTTAVISFSLPFLTKP